MTKLDEIKARWAKVTPGPWKVATGTMGGCPVDAVVWPEADGSRILFEVPASKVRYTKPEERAENEENARAIAAAPEDVAFLLGEVERLTAERDAVVARADEMVALLVEGSERIRRLIRERDELAAKVKP